MLDNDKILNLSDVDDDDFKAIKEAVKDWKSSGYPGKFLFVSEKEAQESLEAVKGLYQRAFNKGVWRGGFAVIGGFVIGGLITKAVEHFMPKEEEE